MSSVDEQLANVAAFHQLSEKLPGLSLEEWRKLVAPWKARMGLMITVGDLRALLDAHEALLARVAELDACDPLTERCGQTGEPLDECGCFECDPVAAEARRVESAP